MEGQGVAASPAGGPGEPGPGAVVAAEFGHPAKSHVTSDIAEGGEDQGRPPAPGSTRRPPSPREEQSSQKSQPEFSSQQIETDKPDNIVDPDRNNNAVARDENTGHNQAAAGVAPSAVDAPAVNAPAAEVSPAAGPPGTVTAAAAGSLPPKPGDARPVWRSAFELVREVAGLFFTL